MSAVTRASRGESQPGPVFVLGVARSGSTLLRLILDTHEDIACPGELYLGRLADRLYHATYYSLGQLQRDDEDARAAMVREAVRDTIDRMMRSYARAKGKSVWAEKTPDNVAHAARLAGIFPDARFVCLYRHPLDHIRSGFESAQFGKLNGQLWDHGSGCEFYVTQTRTLLDFEKAHAGVCFRLAYEDLVRRADVVLASLFAFLRVSPAPDLMSRVFDIAHDQGPGDPKALLASRVYDTSIGRGHEVLPILASMTPRLRDDIARLTAELRYAAAVAPAVPIGSPGNPAGQARTAPSSIAELFEAYLPAKLRPATHLKGAVQVRVKGPGGGDWMLDLNARPPAVHRGTGDADCTITVKADDVLTLTAGETNPGEFYLNAKLKIAGDEAMAMSVGRLLFAPDR